MIRLAHNPSTQEAAVTRLIRRRSGFTMVELLVVIAIIATLSAVAVGALFRVRTAQDKSNTEATLSSVDQKLNQKLKAIQEKVRDPRNKNNDQYKAALSMAGGSDDIAQAILMYAYTKNELPMTFAEAKAPTVIGSLNIPASPIFAALPVGTGIPEESAVCIYLALSSLGTEGLEQQIGDVPNLPGLKCFVDAYRQPICFNRLAYGGDNGELDNPPFVKSPTLGNTFDPYYPKPAKPAGYSNLATDWGAANVTALWTAVRLNTPAWANIPATYPTVAQSPLNPVPTGRNHVSTLISGGLNKSLTEPGGLYTGDNIVSYRLRKEGQKGD